MLHKPEPTQPIKGVLGHSVEGRPVEHWFFPGPTQGSRSASLGSTLILGAIHGDESATRVVLERFAAATTANSLSEAVALPGFALRPGPVHLIPCLNPDGFDRGERNNARGVDLNRNFPSGDSAYLAPFDPMAGAGSPGQSPLSEPESRLLADFILKHRPAKVLSLHWALAEIDADGPQSQALAEAMHAALSPQERSCYRLCHREMGSGRVFQGSLGGWLGFGMRYPDGSRPAMVTLELPFRPGSPRPDPLPPGHYAEVMEAWQSDREAYLAAVMPGVEAMLAAAIAFKP